MSYAIIRNIKYKRENLKGIFRHNERRKRKRMGFRKIEPVLKLYLKKIYKFTYI